MGIDEPGATGLKIHKRIANVGLPLAKSFHFGAMKDDPRLHTFQQVVVVAGSAILRDGEEFAFFVGGLHRFFSGFSHSPQL